MREEKASALPLLLDVRRMDENNRAYAYRMLRKNIMTLQLQPEMCIRDSNIIARPPRILTQDMALLPYRISIATLHRMLGDDSIIRSVCSLVKRCV